MMRTSGRRRRGPPISPYLPISPHISPYLPISPPYLRPTEPRLLAVVIYLHVDVHLVRARVRARGRVRARVRVRIRARVWARVRVRVTARVRARAWVRPGSQSRIDAHLPLQSSHRERHLFRG